MGQNEHHQENIPNKWKSKAKQCPKPFIWTVVIIIIITINSTFEIALTKLSLCNNNIIIKICSLDAVSVKIAPIRIFSGYRQATLAAYTRYFKDFLGFLVLVEVLAYMEYMLQSGMSASNITNHMAGIRAMFVAYGLNPSVLTDNRIPLFLKSVRINRPLQPYILLTLDVPLLEKNIQVCHHFKHPPVFQALYSFCFFSFLRLLNILPHSVATFDSSRHLCRADVIFGDSKALIVIKWSKTLQDRCRTTTVSIPVLGQSVLCPVVALNRFPMLCLCARPLHFMISGGRGLLGPFNMECPYKTSRPRGHGLPSASGDMCISPQLGLRELLTPFVPT